VSQLEDLRPNATIRGILPDCLATVVSVQWFGTEALELTFKDPAGRIANQLLYRHDEPRIEVVELGRPWSFDGDGALFRLVSEAHRIRLGEIFTPVGMNLAAVEAREGDVYHTLFEEFEETRKPGQGVRFHPGAGGTRGRARAPRSLLAPVVPA